MSTAEREEIDKILEGLALAVAESDSIEHEKATNFGEVKIQKLVYMAADEFDIPITYSWYLAGAECKSPNVSATNYEGKYETVSPDTIDNAQFIDSQRSYSAEADVRKYAGYFKREFNLAQDVLFESRTSFLGDFYEEYSPTRFAQVYKHSLSLRTLLRKTISQLQEYVESSGGGTAQAGLSAFGQEQRISAPDHYAEVQKIVSEIHLSMGADEDLKETIPYFRQFTDVLEDMYLQLSKLDVRDLTEEHLSAFKDAQNTHYYDAWKVPGLVISQETALGPEADELRLERARELERHLNEYDEEIANFRERVVERGLLPDHTGFPDHDGTLDDSLNQLEREYISD